MEKIAQFDTDFLFATPTYLSGAASAFKLAGNFYDYNSSETGEEADYKAIANDFNIIGNDLKGAMSTIMDNNPQ